MMKILNAYKYIGDYDSLLCDMKDIKKKYHDYIVSSYIPSLCSENTDYHKLVMNLFNSSYGNEIEYSDAMYDISLDSEIIHFDNIYVVIFFYGLRDIFDSLKIEENKMFSNFSYVNNCDKPEDISENEWDKRSNFYHNLIDFYGSGKPIDWGLSYNISCDGNPYESCRNLVFDYTHVILKK